MCRRTRVGKEKSYSQSSVTQRTYSEQGGNTECERRRRERERESESDFHSSPVQPHSLHQGFRTNMARRCLFWFLALLGLILFAVAASLFILLPNIIAERVKEVCIEINAASIISSSCAIFLSFFFSLSLYRPLQQLPLRNGSEALTKWKRVSVPIYLNVYVFNITNPEQVADHAPPMLQEVGPFVFDETREKDIEYSENATIFYHDLKTFFFNPNRSNLSLDAEVYVANIPLIVSVDLYSPSPL